MPPGNIDMNSALLTTCTSAKVGHTGNGKAQHRSYKTMNKPMTMGVSITPAGQFQDNLDYVISNRIQLQEILDEVTAMQHKLAPPKELVAKAITRIKVGQQ